MSEAWLTSHYFPLTEADYTVIYDDDDHSVHRFDDHNLHDYNDFDYHDDHDYGGYGHHDSHSHHYGHKDHPDADVVLYDFGGILGLGGFVGGTYFPSSHSPFLQTNPLTPHDYDVVTIKKVVYPKRKKRWSRKYKPKKKPRYNHQHHQQPDYHPKEPIYHPRGPPQRQYHQPPRPEYIGPSNNYKVSGNIVPGTHITQ